MKIVCESCGAKYSISDDRVVGKMFKIRCKKCSEVIVVRGDQPQAAAEAQAPEASAGAVQGQTAIWHIVVEGEQAGPYSPAQLADMLTGGSVDWEAYVWTEGFDNWLPMRDVPDLVAQITGQPQAQAAAAAPVASTYRSQQATLTGQPSMGADPFAEDSAGADSGMFGAQAASSDLFARNPAQAGASAFGGSDDPGVVSSSPSPRLSAERVLTGARNENSVLFSLKNLQSLATGSATPSAPPFGASPERGGFAAGEGSGLIDIRALASTTGIGDNADGHKDELLSMGSQGGAFGTLGSPMMASHGDDGDGSKKMLIWGGVAAVALLCTAAVIVVLLLRPQAAAPTATAAVGVASAAPIAAAPAAAPTAPAAAAAPSAAPTEGELAAAKANAEQAAKAADGESSGRSSAASGEHRKKHESTGSKQPTEAAAEPEPTKKAPPAKGGSRSIDDLLDGALSGNSSGKAAKPEASASESNLAPTPTRDQVLSAMNGVKGAVSACAKGETGLATVTVSVAGATGRVTTAQVNGVTGPAGSCIAQAVRKAQFPKFKTSVFKVAFPYKL